MVEIKIGTLNRPWLDRRLPDPQTLGIRTNVGSVPATPVEEPSKGDSLDRTSTGSWDTTTFRH